ncbi:hypothetical protein PENSPDRAFT_691414 [Peniophora sp. CONT]|nr:hypothetical protein PENSPDRAFT_691414 [Peniophora sp. CONT]
MPNVYHQTTTCLKARRKKWPKTVTAAIVMCYECIHHPDDSDEEPECRYKDRRTFTADNKSKSAEVTFNEDADPKDVIWSPLSPPMTEEIARVGLRACADVLKPAFRAHEELLAQYQAIRRPPPLEDNSNESCSNGILHTLVVVNALVQEDYESIKQLIQASPGRDSLEVDWGHWDDTVHGKFDVQSDPSALTYGSFLKNFAFGRPVVVSGLIPGEDDLSPDAFIRHHGELNVQLVDTETDLVLDEEKSLCEYLASFTITGDRLSGQKLKLKDFPSSAHFRSVNSDQLSAFQNGLPCRSITMDDGCMNLLANIPHGSVPPDAGSSQVVKLSLSSQPQIKKGPKGYFAHGHDDVSKGTTTRLHQDVGDAVNVQTWAAPDAVALWYIFDPKQRTELKCALEDLGIARERGWDGHGDPIHSQTVCLAPEDIVRLKRHGIRVNVIEQRVGDAVFIPAGAPHQVTNLRGAMIKIATDFVYLTHIASVVEVSTQLRQHRLDIAQATGSPVVGDEVIPALATAYWTCLRMCKYRSSLRSDPNSVPTTSNLAALPANVLFPVPQALLQSHASSEVAPAPALPVTELQAAEVPAAAAAPKRSASGQTRDNKRRRRNEENTANNPSSRPYRCPTQKCNACFDMRGFLNHLTNKRVHTQRWTSIQSAALSGLQTRFAKAKVDEVGAMAELEVIFQQGNV